MARKSQDNDLFDMLRARGLRKRAARLVSDATRTGRGGAGKSQSAAKAVIGDLRKLADELEDRVTGRGSAKRKEAAKKAARTRARKANARSAAAKKGAATRKRAAAKR